MTDPIPASWLLAQRFHEAYERLAPQYNYSTRKASAVPWADVPDNNKNLMIAVCDELFPQPSGAGMNEFEAAVRQMHNGYTEHFKTPESPLAAIQQLVAEARALAISEVELLNPHIKLDLPDDTELGETDGN